MWGALVNLAAAAQAGKAVVNLNFTTGQAGMDSAAAQAGLKTVVTSRSFLKKGKLEPPSRVELIYLEDVMTGISPQGPLECSRSGGLRPGSCAGTIGGIGDTTDGR